MDPERSGELSPREKLRHELEEHRETYYRLAANPRPLQLPEAALAGLEWGRNLLASDEFRAVVNRIGWPESQDHINSSLWLPPDERGAEVLVDEFRARHQGDMTADSLNNFFQHFDRLPFDINESAPSPADILTHRYRTKPYLMRLWQLCPELANSLHLRLSGVRAADIRQTIASEYEAGDSSLARGVITAHGMMQRLMCPGDLKTQVELLGLPTMEAAEITDTALELYA